MRDASRRDVFASAPAPLVDDRLARILAGSMRSSLVRRLMLAYSAVIAAVLFSAWWSQRSLGDAEHAAARLSERSAQALELSARLEGLIEEKNQVADYVLSGDRHPLTDLRPHREEFAVWMATMEDFVRTDHEHELLDRLRTEYGEYTATFDRLVRREQRGDPTSARTLFARMTTHVQRLLTDGRELAQLAERDMAERRAQADASIDRARAVILWLTGIGGLLSLLFGFLLSRYAARPIYRLALRLSSSGMTEHVQVEGDELGLLEAHVGALLERVRQQERALQQAEKLSEIGEIASEIAHETLNPLAGVKGMLQALRHTSLPPDRLRLELADMERELARIEGIVRRLVRYARPLEPRMQPVLVDQAMADAAAGARRAPGAHGRTIRVAEIGTGLRWVMDPELMQQVLVNLLVNGCEASPEGARGRDRCDGRGRSPHVSGARPRPRHLGEHARPPLPSVLHDQAQRERSRARGQPQDRPRARRPNRGRCRRRRRQRLHGRPAGRERALRHSILIVDDEELIRRSLRMALEAAGYAVTVAHPRARRRSSSSRPSVRIVSSSISGSATPTASKCCAQARERHPDLKAIVITAHGDVDSAVRALRLGAFDFIKKPFDLEEILATVQNALRTDELERRVAYYSAQRDSSEAPCIFESEAMRDGLAHAREDRPASRSRSCSSAARPAPARSSPRAHCTAPRRGRGDRSSSSIAPRFPKRSSRASSSATSAARSRTPASRSADSSSSPTAARSSWTRSATCQRPRRRSSCASRESFEFRRVGGTKLMNVDCRIVAATHRDLENDPSFRRDFLYRLGGVRVDLPPLRERGDDVMLLARHFLAHYARRYRKPLEGFTAASERLLRAHSWPGNVRELKAAISSAAVMADGPLVDEDVLAHVRRHALAAI